MIDEYFFNFNIENTDKFIKELMLQYGLTVNNKTYRFLEFEVYYYSQIHPDKSVFKRDKNSGDLFFHPYGLDICFQSKKDDTGNLISYGGVLIRAIQIKDEMPICGPLNCHDEILSNLIRKENQFYLTLSVTLFEKPLNVEVKKSIRIKGKKHDGYDNYLYRFIDMNFQNEIEKRHKSDYYRKKIIDIPLYELKNGEIVGVYLNDQSK